MLNPTGFSLLRRGRLLWPSFLVLPLMLACESESLRPELLDESELFWELSLNHHAVVMSMADPHDTLTLVASPRNVSGEPLTGLPAPQFTSTDVLKVLVSSDGVLQALGPTSQPVWVRATLTAGNLKYADSVLVRVVATDPPPQLATFSIIPPDSAKLGMNAQNLTGVSPVLAVRALDGGSLPIPNIPVYFSSSDSTILKINRVTGALTTRRLGAATLYATTTAFGVVKTDSLPLTVTWPVFYDVAVLTRLDRNGNQEVVFDPAEIKVGVGAVVRWQKKFVGPLYDVTFGDADLPNVGAPSVSPHWRPFPTFNPPGLLWVLCNAYLFTGGSPTTNCSGGNAVVATTYLDALRVFPVAGTYEYRSTTHGSGGRVVVVSDP
jgi:plastocyanin